MTSNQQLSWAAQRRAAIQATGAEFEVDFNNKPNAKKNNSKGGYSFSPDAAALGA